MDVHKENCVLRRCSLDGGKVWHQVEIAPDCKMISNASGR
jgi:hypothetical protein